MNVTHPDLTYVAEVLDAVDGRADVHVGGPVHALGALALGAQGYLSSEGNLAPRLCVSLIARFDADDRDGAARVHHEILEVHRATQALGGIVGAKAALRAARRGRRLAAAPAPPGRCRPGADAGRRADLARPGPE